MLSNDVQETPRPRPPAKVRRSSSMQFKDSPPPPYAKTPFPVIPDEASGPPGASSLGSPISMSTVHDAAGDVLPSEDWRQERSREELTELLLKADGLIKDRESELGLTSAVCKNLHENNINLKNKHEALLARIPSSLNQSPISSPVMSTPPLSQTPHYYSAGSISRLASTDSRISSSPSLPAGYPRSRHTRRISVSPADIALLSDQNAELLNKLEKLESESTHADQTGRRKLRKLEKEIQGLRDELEKTQAKSEELEEKANKAFGQSDDLLRRREEREERVRALRGKSEEEGDESNEEIRDFAPGGANASPRSYAYPPSKAPQFGLPVSPPPLVNLSTKPISAPSTPQQEPTSSSPRSRLSLQRSPSRPQLEYALLSQLLLKIRELEETNAQITAQQIETSVRLQSVQRDAESISMVYDCLEDDADVELELVVDGDTEVTPKKAASPTGNNTIRFRSLRRTIDGGLRKLVADEADVFESGIAKQSTVRSTNGVNVKGSSASKPRKSVVGLFDDPGSRSGETNVDSTSSTIHATPFSLDMRPPSPTFSTISITSVPISETLREPSPTTGARHTLGSELGSEFGDDWGANAGNHHLRASSLYDLTHISIDPSPSPTPSPAPGAERSSFPDTPTPSMLPESERLKPESWRGKQTPRYHRMSQTIRSRTSQWVDGRFSESLLGLPRGRHEDGAAGDATDVGRERSITPSPVPQRLASAFEGVMERLTSGKGAVGEEDGALEVRRDDAVDQSNDGKEMQMRAQKEGFAAFVLEVWLWLQFTIIIVVFLWAMARRGPKSILFDEGVERKRAPGRVAQ